VLSFACLLLLTANTVNIAADLGGMAAAAELMTGVPSLIFTPLFAAVILLLLVFSSYRALVRVFKWLTLALFAYVITAFLVHPDWTNVTRATFWPRVSFTSDYLMTLSAFLAQRSHPIFSSGKRLGRSRRTSK
jgi:Mn2+/Fe2+ NRAMP family transporter